MCAFSYADQKPHPHGFRGAAMCAFSYADQKPHPHGFDGAFIYAGQKPHPHGFKGGHIATRTRAGPVLGPKTDNCRT